MKNLHTCSCNPLKDCAWWRSVQISWLGPQGNHVLLGNPYGFVHLCFKTWKQRWTEELLLGGLFLHVRVLGPKRGVQPLRKAFRFAMWDLVHGRWWVCMEVRRTRRRRAWKDLFLWCFTKTMRFCNKWGHFCQLLSKKGLCHARGVTSVYQTEQLDGRGWIVNFLNFMGYNWRNQNIGTRIANLCQLYGGKL
jgi:hypothetical protein